ANSEVIIENLPQDGIDHHGGHLQFGSDGTLYVGTGDGGGPSDPLNHGQDTGSLLGKILRLDVNNPPTYAFGGNPFVNPGLPLDELWALGVRDPWRFSLDRHTGDLYLADIGQSGYEEIDFQPATSNGGENYGWRCMEASHCTGLTGCTCNAPALTQPVVEYVHPAQGCARVIGGFVYRGCLLPNMLGTYFYADYCSGEIHSLRMVNGLPTEQTDRTAQLTPSGGSIQSIISFGEDANGELYIVSRAGSIYKIVRTSFCGNNILEPGEECDDGNTLSGDGCSATCHLEVGPINDACVNAKAAAEGPFGFEILDATTDGPNESAACGVSAAGHPLGNDIWYCYMPTCTGTATATLCGATNFDSMVAAYDGCSCPTSPSAIACVNDSCGTDAAISFPVTACESKLIRVGGFNSSVGTGTLTINCAPHALVNDCNGNGVEDAADIACRTLTDGNGNGIPDVCEAVGDRLRGGRMYDTWWLEAGVAEPSSDHPLWQYRPDMVSDGATGSATWKCNECHGWDYLGASGQYASGPQHTGFSGIRGTQLSGTALFDLLKQPPSNGGGAGVLNGHNYATVLSDNDIHDVVAFVLLGTVDSNSYINPSNGVFLGDPVQGGSNYTGGGTQTHCVTCHGSRGTNINFGTPTEPEFLGTTAVNEPWLFLHRARMGFPGGEMIGWLTAGGNDQGAADIGRYAQLNFPTECANDSQCDDGIACTVDSCDASGRCVHTPNSNLCADDSIFCNGPEVCDASAGCVSLGNPCGNPANCNEGADSCGCLAPIVSTTGPRYLAITPQSSSPGIAMSILVAPSCLGGVAKYVGMPSGPNNIAYLVDTRAEAAVLTADEWGGVVYVSGIDIAPSVTYGLQADCGGPAFPSLTQAVQISTPMWGDVSGAPNGAPDGFANIVDVAAVVDGFKQIPTAKPLTTLDLFGCVPNQRIDVTDVAGAVDAFKGRSYRDSLCPGPCW
ncbi:MAG: PQQ-dependent sugar dehydrogenase, partial [Planctomycetes bacterium]|nr:PQQ-dependent sugar dehydrogenase [Planctomycetota bacterium]